MFVALCCLVVGFPAPASGQVTAVAVDAGEHSVLRHHGDGGEVGAEVRFTSQRLAFLPRFIPDFVPVVGASRTSKGTVYGYGGFRLDFPMGNRFLTTIGFAAGDYHQGDGKKLGGPVEFRSNIEIAARVGAGSRLGLCLYHLSNAGLYDHNPGSESLVLAWTVGLGTR
jgi:hypothetical protein